MEEALGEKNMSKLFEYMAIICDAYEKDNIDIYWTTFAAMQQDKRSFECENKDEVHKRCEALLPDYSSPYVHLFIYSVMITISRDKDEIANCINYMRSSNLDYISKYKMLCQIIAWMFFYSNDLMDNNTMVITTQFLKEIVDEVKDGLPRELFEPIPSKELDHNTIVVITSQFLNPNHGPTRHALDHCASIIRCLNKKVLIINTAETGGGVGNIILVNDYFWPNYYEQLNDIDSYPWEGYNIPFFQCDDNMPNTEEIALIINTIRQIKPYLVIEIGSGSIVTGLIDIFLPVLVNGTLHSAIETSAPRYQTIARNLNDAEKVALNALGRNENNMIFSMFSTEINRKDEVITRNILGVPEDAFVIAIIGNRLHYEINKEFVDVLVKAVQRCEEMYVLFFGKFDNYEELMLNHSEFKNRIIYYGYTTYTLGCLEKCDLYINPYRAGGGMSAIEAMVAGIPAISTSYGDAGVVLGKEFWVDSLDDYYDIIIRYYSDSSFYGVKSEKAKERGVYLQDSDRIWIDTLLEFERIAVNDNN